MKKVWKRINGKVKIAVLICCTLIGGYGISKATASDQSEMEQELMQKENQTTAPIPSTSPETDMQKGKTGKYHHPLFGDKFSF